ncbi:Cytochrome P450 monooxygenase TRI13 [Paramyrothecium foliicola]|nr:Cytochrome P450 monooxygenase TRI13 [Paramyrothecium foliicola]
MISYLALGSSLACLGFVLWRRLLPKPYPGIPHNKHSAERILGDVPDLVPLIQATNEFSNSILTITTQKLQSPIAQLLFPGLRNPLIILDEPREIEHILSRRSKEFDKAPTAIDIFSPMFPHATLGQYTTPQLRAQKRLWAHIMNREFLRRAVAPNIYSSTLQLLTLWQTKATTKYKDQAFNAHEDFQNAALDAIWVAMVGDEPGFTRYEIDRLQNELNGDGSFNEKPPRESFLKKEVVYIADTIARNSNSPMPKWALKLETFTPRYRSFRATIAHQVSQALESVVDRFHRLNLSTLDDDELDTCIMDLVLRKQILEQKKAGKPPVNPLKDHRIVDEMFAMLVGGFDSTSNALSWFVRFMEANPTVQTELRTALQAAFPGPDLPSVEEMFKADIPYLDAACEESFRLSGVAKANLRQATTNTKVLGYDIPKGAEIFMNYHINHAPLSSGVSKLNDGFSKRPGENLEVFEPKRWLTREKSQGMEAFDPNALPSLAFGGGYRGCSGRKLALMEFRIVITILVLKLEFLELPQEHKSMAATEKIFRQPDKPYVKVKAIGI